MYWFLEGNDGLHGSWNIDSEINCIPHLWTPVEVAYGLREQNLVRVVYFLIVISKKHCCQDIHLFHDHLHVSACMHAYVIRTKWLSWDENGEMKSVKLHELHQWRIDLQYQKGAWQRQRWWLPTQSCRYLGRQHQWELFVWCRIILSWVWPPPSPKASQWLLSH